MSVLYTTLPLRVNVIPSVKWPGFYWGVRFDCEKGNGFSIRNGFGFTQITHGRAIPYATRVGALRAGRAAAYRWASQQCEQQQGYRNAPRKPMPRGSQDPPKALRNPR